MILVSSITADHASPPVLLLRCLGVRSPLHTSMASSCHRGTDALPPAVLAHILQFVPPGQRLRHCALVSTAWATAAAAATPELEHRCVWGGGPNTTGMQRCLTGMWLEGSG